MSSVLPVLLLAFAGFLVGGAYSLHAQKKSRWSVIVVGALALLSLTAAVLNW